MATRSAVALANFRQTFCETASGRHFDRLDSVAYVAIVFARGNTSGLFNNITSRGWDNETC